MRWDDERYVRLFTRDTGNWIRMPWTSRAVFMEILRKVDRAGILDLGDEPIIALADLIRFPIEIVNDALPFLTTKHWIRLNKHTLSVPNFVPAQETKKSDAQRKREQRERDAFTKESEHSESINVTKRDQMSRDVTRPVTRVTGMDDLQGQERGTLPSNVGELKVSEIENVTKCHSVLSVPSVPFALSRAREDHVNGKNGAEKAGAGDLVAFLQIWASAGLPKLSDPEDLAQLSGALETLGLDRFDACVAFCKLCRHWRDRRGILCSETPAKMREHLGFVQRILSGELALAEVQAPETRGTGKPPQSRTNRYRSADEHAAKMEKLRAERVDAPPGYFEKLAKDFS